MPFTPAQTRRYKFDRRIPGIHVLDVLEIITRPDGTERRGVILELPLNTSNTTRMEILDALNRVYADGREDRALGVPPEERSSQDLGAAWDGGAMMARAVHGHDPEPGEHVHVQRTRYVHSHEGGTAEHSHPHPHGSSEEPQDGPSGVVKVPSPAPALGGPDRWIGGLETAQALKPSLLNDGVPEFLDDYDNFHAHQSPAGMRYLHAHEGGPAEHEHRSDS
jgi:hypothetical protein